MQSTTRVTDALSLHKYPAVETHAGDFRQSVRAGLPSRLASSEVNQWRLRNFAHLVRGVPAMLAAARAGVPHFYGVLALRVVRVDGTILDLGVVSHQMITTAGVNKLVAGMNATDTATFSTFKYHGFGSGATGPAIGDTTLGTEYTTEYTVNSTRPTGSQTTGGSSNVYRTVGTFTPDAAVSPTEMGLFSAASAGTLLDRFTFSAVALNGTGDSLQTTVDITLAAGS